METKGVIFKLQNQHPEDFENGIDTSFCVRVFDKNYKQIALLIADPYNETCTLSVNPNFQRMGIATKLLKMYINYTRQTSLKQLKFVCSNSNMSAINLYKKIGFNLSDISNNNSQLLCVFELLHN